MPVNPGIEFQLARDKFERSATIPDRLKYAQEMLSTVPKHKGSESLQKEIKERISKYKKLLEKEKSRKKGSKTKFSVKKEGAATVCLIGTPFSGKTQFLSSLTNIKHGELNIGIIDYYGIKIQILEILSIHERFEEARNGPALISVIRNADLLIYFFNNPEEKRLIDSELDGFKNIPKLIYNNQKNIKDLIWEKLGLIKVYTKQPGKEKEYPPLALKKKSTVHDFAVHIHKDFAKKLTFARVWGLSARFDGQRVNLKHVLKDNDIVELHLK